MTRPTRVRVSLELTEDEAIALRHYVLDGITGRDCTKLTQVARDLLDVAICRGLGRYRVRTGQADG